MRWKFNLFPAYRGTGGRITYISGDLREVRVRIPLNWRTRNYVGTIYGGSLYGAVDPMYMIMLIRILGSAYNSLGQVRLDPVREAGPLDADRAVCRDRRGGRDDSGALRGRTADRSYLQYRNCGFRRRRACGRGKDDLYKEEVISCQLTVFSSNAKA